MHSSTSIVRRRVRDLMGPPPTRAAPTQPLAEALNAMAAAKPPCLAITDPDGRPLALLTDTDVVQRSVWAMAPGDPVMRAARRPLITVAESDSLFRAIAVMQRHQMRAAAVVDATGRLTGLLELRTVLWSLAGPATGIMEMMGRDGSIEGLAAAKATQVSLARALLADSVPGPDVQYLLSEMNVDLHRRALSHAVADMEKNGWGQPPVEFSLILMGSHGRAENFLAPDQDHAMVLADYPDSEHDLVNAYFVPLATRLMENLDRIGFVVCKGNVMSTNPVWRKRLSEWRAQVAGWVSHHTDQQLLMSDILLDFRHAAGDERLSIGLRDALMEAIRRRPRFVRELFSIEQDHVVALGWFGRLSKENDEDDRPGFINLKMRGSLPLVEGVRLMCLMHRLPLSGSTLRRLDALKASGRIDADTHDYLTHGYSLISKLLLQSQIEAAEQGLEPNDYVEESLLRKRERDQLVACLKEIETLRAGLKLELSEQAM